MNKINVALLCGGRSSEHEVSLTSASYVWEYIDKKKFDPILVLLGKDGGWYYIQQPLELVKMRDKLIDDASSLYKDAVLLDYTKVPRIIDIATGGKRICKEVQVVFPILHGKYGEDGSIQGLCKLAKLPCVGSGVLSSALGMDKVVAKQVLSFHHLPVTPFVSFKKYQWIKNPKEWIDKIIEELPFPLFVKPANAGSSVGITKVYEKEKLNVAIDHAFIHDTKVLVEQGIDAQELECAVLGNDSPIASVVGEIVASGDFYDYNAKYISGKSKTLIPAQIDNIMQKTIQKVALDVYNVLDCAGFARVDFLLEKHTQQLYINEINTIPGFTAISMYPKLMEAVGIPYQSLISKLIDFAFEEKL